MKPDISELSNTQIRETIDEYIHNERNREILKRRLCDHICFEPLASEFNLSVQRVKAIVYKSQETLFKHFK